MYLLQCNIFRTKWCYRLLWFCLCVAVLFIWSEYAQEIVHKKSIHKKMQLHHLNWVFLGDSTMHLTFRAFVNDSLMWNCIKKKVSTRCNLYQYLGMKARKNWTNPAIFEGPKHYGLDHQHCSDCITCIAYYYNCQSGSLEFLPVAYARDVTLQTNITSTTQQTVAVYLKNKQKHICIVNTGVHDLGIKGLNVDIFIHHVREYLSLLKPVCERIYWVAMTAVKGETVHPQTNKKVQLWNSMVENLIKTEMPQINFINRYSASVDKSLHKDNVHMIMPYYTNFSRLLKKIILLS